jgi:fructose 1,6-bisphosphatase
MGNEEAQNGSMLKRVGEFELARLATEGMEYIDIQQICQKLETLHTAEENRKKLLAYSRQMG